MHLSLDISHGRWSWTHPALTGTPLREGILQAARQVPSTKRGGAKRRGVWIGYLRV